MAEFEDDELFCNEKNVILKTQWEVTRNHLRYYLLKHLPQFQENTLILILCGKHGLPSGKLDETDEGLFHDFKPMEKLLCKDGHEELLRKQKIEISVQKIDDWFDNPQMGFECLSKNNERPIVLVLATCFSKVNELNDVLRSAGVFSFLRMAKDRAEFCNFFVLDSEQHEIIKKISDDHGKNDISQTKNVLLWGDNGTGKTLLLAEALLMRISFYIQMDMLDKVVVFVTSYNQDAQKLVTDVISKYLDDLGDKIQINYIGGLESVMKGKFEKKCSRPFLISSLFRSWAV